MLVLHPGRTNNKVIKYSESETDLNLKQMYK